MSDQPKSEMFMQFVTEADEPLLAECAADKDKDDRFMKDFHPEDVDSYSDFFEVTKFDYGVKVNSGDKSKDDAQGGRGTPPGRGSRPHTPAPANAQQGQKKQGGGDEWHSWRAANSDRDVDNLKYPFEVSQFKFDRIIDRASIDLFTACCKSQTFKSAVFVKRVAMGGGAVGGGSAGGGFNLNLNASAGASAGAGGASASAGLSAGLNMGGGMNMGGAGAGKPAQAYLRIDFYEVLVTHLDWDDGDLLSESCTFICRKGFKIQYRRQKSDGSLLEPVVIEWNADLDALGGRRTGT